MTQNQKKSRTAESDLEDNGGKEAGLSSDSQAFIGLKLRELYDDVVAEPVPDRLKQLLDRLGDDEKAAQ